MRYMVRKEFFGAYVYDRECRMYLLFDKESYELLNNISIDNNYIDTLEKDIIELLENEEFIIGNIPNYYIIDNGKYENVLSAPMRMHLMYTEKCNLNCIHCFSKEDNVKSKIEMTFQEKIQILDEMQKIGMCEILIGGGEPFIKDDIFEYIDECNKRSIVVKIFTNGLLFKDKNFNKLLNAKIAYLAVSVDGANSEYYKKTRGVDGLEIIKNNIIKLKKKGCEYPIVISTTLNNYNCQDPLSYLKLMKEIHADRLKIRATKPNGNINKNREVMVEADKYRDFLSEIQCVYNEKYFEEFGLDLTWGDFRLYYDEITGSLEVLGADLPYENYGCVAGKTAMCINADGMGVPCGFLPESLQFTGEENNVIKNGILGVWHNGKSFLELRNMNGNDKCRKCELYDICRGGCVARNLFYKNEKDGVDPWCIKEYFPIEIRK